jgi:hypothetical protein
MNIAQMIAASGGRRKNIKFPAVNLPVGSADTSAIARAGQAIGDRRFRAEQLEKQHAYDRERRADLRADQLSDWERDRKLFEKDKKHDEDRADQIRQANNQFKVAQSYGDYMQVRNLRKFDDAMALELNATRLIGLTGAETPDEMGNVYDTLRAINEEADQDMLSVHHSQLIEQGMDPDEANAMLTTARSRAGHVTAKEIQAGLGISSLMALKWEQMAKTVGAQKARDVMNEFMIQEGQNLEIPIERTHAYLGRMGVEIPEMGELRHQFTPMAGDGQSTLSVGMDVSWGRMEQRMDSGKIGNFPFWQGNNEIVRSLLNEERFEYGIANSIMNKGWNDQMFGSTQAITYMTGNDEQVKEMEKKWMDPQLNKVLQFKTQQWVKSLRGMKKHIQDQMMGAVDPETGQELKGYKDTAENRESMENALREIDHVIAIANRGMRNMKASPMNEKADQMNAYNRVLTKVLTNHAAEKAARYKLGQEDTFRLTSREIGEIAEGELLKSIERGQSWREQDTVSEFPSTETVDDIIDSFVQYADVLPKDLEQFVSPEEWDVYKAGLDRRNEPERQLIAARQGETVGPPTPGEIPAELGGSPQEPVQPAPKRTPAYTPSRAGNLSSGTRAPGSRYIDYGPSSLAQRATGLQGQAAPVPQRAPIPKQEGVLANNPPPIPLADTGKVPVGPNPERPAIVPTASEIPGHVKMTDRTGKVVDVPQDQIVSAKAAGYSHVRAHAGRNPLQKTPLLHPELQRRGREPAPIIPYMGPNSPDPPGTWPVEGPMPGGNQVLDFNTGTPAGGPMPFADLLPQQTIDQQQPPTSALGKKRAAVEEKAAKWNRKNVNADSKTVMAVSPEGTPKQVRKYQVWTLLDKGWSFPGLWD